MRTSVCLAAVLLLTVASGSLPALADDRDPRAELRSAQQRIAALEQELRMARLQAASDKAWTQHLYAFVADCLRRLAEQGMESDPADHAHEASIASLESDVQEAQDQRRKERARHTSDVRQLQVALRSEQDRAAAETKDLQVALVHARDQGEEARRHAALSKQQAQREVKKALRSTLFKYKLHQDTDLFDRAYGYIREYY